MKKIIAVIILLAGFIESGAQFTRHIVRFRDKGDNTYSLSNPNAFLSQRAIDRRTRYSIPYDSTDLPATKRYVDSLRAVPNVTVLNISKWLNQVSIQTSDAAALAKINSFPFVLEVAPIAARMATGNSGKFDRIHDQPGNSLRSGQVAADFYNYGTNSFNEIHLHNGEFLHNIGLRGQGIVISMLDGGFLNYNTLDALDSMNANGQVLGTWDFVNRNSAVADDISHGMQCLSTIAANIPGQFIGKAPKANFYLFRTEDAATEYPIEEHNWVCGAEWADSTGSDLISSSLGYMTFDNPMFDYTYSDMDGNTTMTVKGADLAAKKGLLVFTAAGNEGNGAWHWIITPADGDSVVAVGAVNSSGVVGGFSSYGPSSDGQVKPDVASIGVGALVQFSNNTVGTSNGTSFACPNMAGLGACLWQGFPEFNNMRIVTALREAGSISTAPNDRIGYGIPNMKTAFTNLLLQFATVNGTSSTCKSTINWTSKDMSLMKYEIERKTAAQSSFTKVGEISGQGAVLANHTYQYADTLINVAAGNVQYRIKQIVDTAAASFTAVYLDTISLNNATSCITTGVDPVDPNLEYVRLLPNPAVNLLNVQVNSPYPMTDLQVRVMDINGAEYYRMKTSKSSGLSTIQVPVHKLAAGKYIIVVYHKQKIFASEEFVKTSSF